MYFSLNLSGEISHLNGGSPDANLPAAIDFQAQCTERSRLFGGGNFYEFFFPGLHFGYICNSRGSIGLKTYTPQVQLLYPLKGTFKLTRQSGPCCRLRENKQAIWFFPDGDYQLTIGELESELIVISLGVDFYKNHLPHQHQAHLIIEDGLSDVLPAALHHSDIQLDATCRALLQEILDCKKPVFLKRLFTEAKVVELIMLQMEQTEFFLNREDEKAYQKTDIEKMYQVRDLIKETLNTPCSLIDLAHKVGTNEFNLKKDFKKVFGTTVFKYSHKLRMEKAKELILRGGLNISEIAYLVGYQHATHFTAAFKKHFGYIPKDLKS